MPDASLETGIQAQPDIKIPRAEILNLVGISQEVAQKFAQEESHEAQRLKISHQYGQEAYDLLTSGQKLEIVRIGSGQFPILPVETPAEFVKQATITSREINPTPPQDEIKEMLSGVAEKALSSEPREFDVAVACYNYVADDNLKVHVQLIEKLKAAAADDHQKYELAKALDQVIPAPTSNEQTVTEPTSQIFQPENKAPRLPFASFRGTHEEPENSQSNVTQEAIHQTTAQDSLVSESNSPLNGQSQNSDQPPVISKLNLKPVPPRAEPTLHLAQSLPKAA